MAKGNNGNYLQHGVEVAVAVHLAARNPQRRLHVALAHGMAPFEPCGELPNGQARALLHDALRAAQIPAVNGEPPIVAAYRATNASLEHYPNTSELLRAMIGQDRLSGGITEVDAGKHKQLEAVWSGSGITPVKSSWRNETTAGGVLMCPVSLGTPWLFAADPMTYREDGYTDDDKLYRADLSRVSAVLNSFVSSGQPGMAALFVYAVKPDVQSQFWTFIDEIAKNTSTGVFSCWVQHQGGNRNLAALLCSAFMLPDSWLPVGLNAGR